MAAFGDDTRKIFKAYVCGLSKLHDIGLSHGGVAKSMMVVNGRGALLRVAVANSHSPINDYVEMGSHIQVLFSKFQTAYFPRNLHPKLFYFTSTLRLVSVETQCEWFKYLPFILSPQKAVNILIPKLAEVINGDRRIQAHLENIVVPWTNYISEKAPWEFRRVYEFQNASAYNDNAADFARYIRNDYAHLNKYGQRGVYGAKGSMYMKDHQRFLDLIDTVYPQFLEMIFYMIVIDGGATCMIKPKVSQEGHWESSMLPSGNENYHISLVNSKLEMNAALKEGQLEDDLEFPKLSLGGPVLPEEQRASGSRQHPQNAPTVTGSLTHDPLQLVPYHDAQPFYPQGHQPSSPFPQGNYGTQGQYGTQEFDPQGQQTPLQYPHGGYGTQGQHGYYGSQQFGYQGGYGNQGQYQRIRVVMEARNNIPTMVVLGHFLFPREPIPLIIISRWVKAGAISTVVLFPGEPIP